MLRAGDPGCENLNCKRPVFCADEKYLQAKHGAKTGSAWRSRFAFLKFDNDAVLTVGNFCLGCAFIIEYFIFSILIGNDDGVCCATMCFNNYLIHGI